MEEVGRALGIVVAMADNSGGGGTTDCETPGNRGSLFTEDGGGREGGVADAVPVIVEGDRSGGDKGRECLLSILSLSSCCCW